MQFWTPDDEHMFSKHVEAWNKLIVKQKILCIKLVNYWDKKKLAEWRPNQQQLHIATALPTYTLLWALIFQQELKEGNLTLWRLTTTIVVVPHR